MVIQLLVPGQLLLQSLFARTVHDGWSSFIIFCFGGWQLYLLLEWRNWRTRGVRLSNRIAWILVWLHYMFLVWNWQSDKVPASWRLCFVRSATISTILNDRSPGTSLVLLSNSIRHWWDMGLPTNQYESQESIKKRGLYGAAWLWMEGFNNNFFA